MKTDIEDQGYFSRRSLNSEGYSNLKIGKLKKSQKTDSNRFKEYQTTMKGDSEILSKRGVTIQNILQNISYLQNPLVLELEVRSSFQS